MCRDDCFYTDSGVYVVEADTMVTFRGFYIATLICRGWRDVDHVHGEEIILTWHPVQHGQFRLKRIFFRLNSFVSRFNHYYLKMAVIPSMSKQMT